MQVATTWSVQMPVAARFHCLRHSLFTHLARATNQNFSAVRQPRICQRDLYGSCGWTAVSNSSFITITSGATGTAPGKVGFTVAANTGPNQRTGTITIGDKTFTVTQDGLNCSYSIAPTASNFSAGSDSSSVNVTATAGCAWTAVSNDSWLTITSGAAAPAMAPTNYSVAANTGPARTGTLTVAGQTVTVTQANGCTFVLSPSAQNFPASFAAGAVNVTSSSRLHLDSDEQRHLSSPLPQEQMVRVMEQSAIR